MSKLAQMRETAAEKARVLVDGAKAEERSLTPEELEQVKSFVTEIKGYDEQIKAAMEADDLLASIGSMPEIERKNADGSFVTLGEHFVKHAFSTLKGRKGQRFDVAAPEYLAKAATDPQLLGTSGTGLVPAELDRTFVTGVRRRLTVADWLGAGTLTSNAITYFVEGALEGSFGTVAENGQKPQLHFAEYTPITENLKKIAGFIKLSDEMSEDAAFVVSEIEGRLLFELRLFEENQLLSGDGTGTNVLGLLNRTGVQTESSMARADNVDAIFRAITKVETGAALTADGIVINPLDYQALRLAKDANGQYYGGGPFGGAYGNDGLLLEPPLWGKTPIVTPAITAGTVLVGAGKQAATVYRKGGIRVEATNSDGTDFQFNRVTMRAEERVALAVRKPAGFVKVTLSTV